jgi:glycosyltransferase involved in cell wall biosynthesis
MLDELGAGGDRGIDWKFIVADPVFEERFAADSVPVPLEPQSRSPARRIFWEQIVLGKPSRSNEVLVSAGNFGPLARRRRHILMIHSHLLFDGTKLRGREGLRLRVQSALAQASARRAEVTITSSREMTDLVAPMTRRRPEMLPLGPGRVKHHVSGPPGRFTFVHRTHWGPHKRFGELLLAVRQLAASRAGTFQLVTGCDPRTAYARRFHESQAERKLLDDQQIASHVRFETFGPEGQATLEGDAVVMPSTAEAFCIPLGEAVALGVPVVAADTPFARALCGPGAFFVPSGEPPALAAAMERLINGERPPPTPADVRAKLSWAVYVDRLAELCRAAAGAP